MSTLKINLANFFAKQSCSAWQKNRIVRKLCRDTYRLIMETGAANYPYANSDFADWPESDGDSYTLVTDSSNFVIRHSASYIAWMMKKHCGGWPKLPVPGERKPGEHNFDAKHWNEVLEFNGWQELSEYEWPEMAAGSDDTHYIGIMPGEGEFGQLVWLMHAGSGDSKKPRKWYVLTYQDLKKQNLTLPVATTSNIIWYREPDHGKVKI
jgi:hypothetical protein